MDAAAKRATTTTQSLANKTFVITGTMQLTRGELEALIKQHGGRTSSSVSKKTDYVLAGVDPGSKLAKAKELGIPVIGENDLREMLTNRI